MQPDALAARVAGDYAAALTDTERQHTPPAVTLHVAVVPVVARTRKLTGGSHRGPSWLNETFKAGAILPETVPAADLAHLVASGLVRPVTVTINPEGPHA